MSVALFFAKPKSKEETMLARIPVIPGPAEAIAAEVAEGADTAEWYPCSGPVDIGWVFNGVRNFTPPAP